ncbi:hypothetical protein QJS66_07175 [Kocuria rhizophila]|nr:hypothetical protein QJS66_07175 [Kocuria rhizophila]
MGDSFTEGVGDPDDTVPQVRGWAAASPRSSPAPRRRRLRRAPWRRLARASVDEQLEPALELTPDLRDHQRRRQRHAPPSAAARTTSPPGCDA